MNDNYTVGMKPVPRVSDGVHCNLFELAAAEKLHGCRANRTGFLLDWNCVKTKIVRWKCCMRELHMRETNSKRLRTEIKILLH